MTWPIIWLVVNSISLSVVSYAAWDAWKEYLLAMRYNGWTRLATYAQLMSQLNRLTCVILMILVAVVAILWPTPEATHIPFRPPFATNMIRVGLTGVTVLIALDSVMNYRIKKRILNHK